MPRVQRTERRGTPGRLMGRLTGLSAALVLAVAGCGGSSSTGSTVDAWVGNWMEGGTQSTTCAGASTTTQISMVTIISAGTKDGTIQTLADSCPLNWDVGGSKATLETGQACTVSIDGVNATVGWTASSMTLNGNTITGTAGGATTSGCSFTQQFTLTKM